MQVGDILAPDIGGGLGARSADTVKHRRDGSALARQDFAFGVADCRTDGGEFVRAEYGDCGTAVGGAVAVIVAQIGVGMGVRASAGQLAQRIGSCGDRLRAQRLTRKICRDLRGADALYMAFERKLGRFAVDLHSHRFVFGNGRRFGGAFGRSM